MLVLLVCFFCCCPHFSTKNSLLFVVNNLHGWSIFVTIILKYQYMKSFEKWIKKCLGLSQTLYTNLRDFILQLQWHISKSNCHTIAIELEKSKEDFDVELIDITQDKSRQTRIETLALSSSRKAYIWMLITAYEIALHPNASLSMFSIFIKV